MPIYYLWCPRFLKDVSKIKSTTGGEWNIIRTTTTTGDYNFPVAIVAVK